MDRVEAGDKYTEQGETKESRHVIDAMNIVRLGRNYRNMRNVGR